MSFEIHLADFKLEHPVMNAAGTVKTVEDTKQALRSSAAGVVIGSITMESRPGNTGNVYHADEVRSLNSLGLPNPGRAYWREHLPSVVERAHALGKSVIVNVLGFTFEEYAILAETMFAAGADAVELNLDCPNIWEEGEKQKAIPSFNSELIRRILSGVSQAVGDKRVGVKLSPFSDPNQLQRVAQLLGTLRTSHPCLKFVTISNTFPNASAYDEAGKLRITPGGGLAGMAGPALKAIALGQVRQFREVLPASIQIVGVGGISSGRDVRDYLRAGATAVQVATAYLERGQAVFSDILTELVESAPAEEAAQGFGD